MHSLQGQPEKARPPNHHVILSDPEQSRGSRRIRSQNLPLVMAQASLSCPYGAIHLQVARRSRVGGVGAKSLEYAGNHVHFPISNRPPLSRLRRQLPSEGSLEATFSTHCSPAFRQGCSLSKNLFFDTLSSFPPGTFSSSRILSEKQVFSVKFCTNFLVNFCILLHLG